MKLTKEEKDYLFSKLEYNKRKTAEIKKNELYNLLKDDKNSEFSDDDVKLIFKSLEYSFRKRLEGSKPDLNNDIFKSIKSKLPDGLFLVSYSNLKARDKRLNKRPTIRSKKEDIIDYLKRNDKDFNPKDTKANLIKSIGEKKHVLDYKSYTESLYSKVDEKLSEYETNKLLDKISKYGIKSLTSIELLKLKNANNDADVKDILIDNISKIVTDYGQIITMVSIEASSSPVYKSVDQQIHLVEQLYPETVLIVAYGGYKYETPIEEYEIPYKKLSIETLKDIKILLDNAIEYEFIQKDI